MHTALLYADQIIDKSKQQKYISHGSPTVANFQRLSFRYTTWRQIPLHLLSTHASPGAMRLFSASSYLQRHDEKMIKSKQTLAKMNSPSQAEVKAPTLTHLTSTGTAHMVSISSKDITKRTAIATCSVYFSNPVAATLIRSNQAKKGDVLGVARLAGIMASKRTAELIPLCHPIAITHVSVDVDLIRGDEVLISSTEEHQVANTNARESIQWAGTGQGDAYCSSDDSKPAPKTHFSKAAQPLPLAGEKTEVNPSVYISATVSCEGKTGVEMEALTAASVAALTVYDMCKAVDKGMRIEGLRVVRKEGGKSGTWVEGKSVA